MLTIYSVKHVIWVGMVASGKMLQTCEVNWLVKITILVVSEDWEVENLLSPNPEFKIKLIIS